MELLRDDGSNDRAAAARGDSTSRRPRARDGALPSMGALLDRDTVARLLARSIRGTGVTADVTVERVMYKPGRRSCALVAAAEQALSKIRPVP